MTPGNGYQTPSKLLKDGAKDGVSSHPPTPLIPVVRSALDIVADLYVLLPEIKSYVRHMVTSGSFLFLKSYIISVDPKTVISAANFVSDIISDFSTSKYTGNSVAENEKKLDVNDVKEFYNCAFERLRLYCEIRDDSVQRNAIQYSKSANNAISNQDMKNDDKGNESNKKDEMEIDDPGVTGKATFEKPFGDVVSVSDKARNIVLQPLIRSLSILIDKCLHAADALSFDEQRKFYSIEKSISNSVNVSLCENAKVLLLSMRIAFKDLILSYSEKRENDNMSSEKYGTENNNKNILHMESRNNYCKSNEMENKNTMIYVSENDKTNRMVIEEKDEIFDRFLSRKRQLILTILSSISLLRSHTILQTENEMKEAKLQKLQQCQKSSTSTSDSSLKNFDTEIKSFFGFFMQREINFSLLQKVFLSVLIQGGVGVTELLNSENEIDHDGESYSSSDRMRLLSALRLFYHEIKNECENKEVIVIDDNDITYNENDINNISNDDNDMKISISNPDNIKVQTNKILNNNDHKSNNANMSMSTNVKSDSIKNDYDGQGSDESQNSCLLTLTCLGATSLTNTTNNTRKCTCENIQKCRTNCNSPERNVSGSVKNAKHVFKSEIKNEFENDNRNENENFEYQNLSTAFTPAHSKNRQIFDIQDDSGIQSPSCTDHITENNEESESFQNSKSTIFDIEINHDDEKIDNERENDIYNLENNRLSNIDKIERNFHQEKKSSNTATVENKNTKKLLISDNVKRFDEDDDTLDLTNMSIEDCSRTMTLAVTGARVGETHIQPVILSQSKPLVASIPAPVSLPLSISSSLPAPVTVPVTLPFSSPVPALTSPTLAVILTETKASANALRHTLSYGSTSSTYAPVSIQSFHLDSAATAATATSTSSHSSSSSSSSSSSCSSSSSHHSPTHQSIHLNGYTGSTVSDEEDLDGTDCVSRLRNVLSASDVTATQLEMKSICEENLLWKKLRDSSVVDRMSQQAIISALHLESAGIVLKSY
jgi:hypothetical protein